MKMTSQFFLAAAFLIFVCANNSGLADDGWIPFHAPKGSGCVRKRPGGGIEGRGDFMGDKKMDVARIEINKTLKKGRLALRIDDEKSPSLILKEWNDVDEDDFVAVVDPGTQKTWCGKTGECNQGEAKSLRLKTQAIAFGTYESSQEVFYWDSTSKKFKEIFISD